MLLAYQIGFDLYESATQDFLQRVLAALRKTPQLPAATEKPADERCFFVISNFLSHPVCILEVTCLFMLMICFSLLKSLQCI